MTTQTVEFKELKDFILSRKDNKKIDMTINWDSPSEDLCGCILVHFGKVKGFRNFNCSWDYIRSKNEGIKLSIINGFDFISCCIASQVSNYKEAKEALNYFNDNGDEKE